MSRARHFTPINHKTADPVEKANRLTTEEKKAVYKTLSAARRHGLAWVREAYGGQGLPWWKDKLNALLLWLGAENEPFRDPSGYRIVSQRPLWKFASENAVESAIKKLSADPRCRICGSKHLTIDPSAYYVHARRWDGAPMMCLDHKESEENVPKTLTHKL